MAFSRAPCTGCQALRKGHARRPSVRGAVRVRGWTSGSRSVLLSLAECLALYEGLRAGGQTLAIRMRLQPRHCTRRLRFCTAKASLRVRRSMQAEQYSPSRSASASPRLAWMRS